MAVQQRLGLLPVRRPGSGLGDRHLPARAGPHLTLRAMLTATRVETDLAEGSKTFFFEKKKQKTFVPTPFRKSGCFPKHPAAASARTQKFLVLVSKGTACFLRLSTTIVSLRTSPCPTNSPMSALLYARRSRSATALRSPDATAPRCFVRPHVCQDWSAARGSRHHADRTARGSAA